MACKKGQTDNNPFSPTYKQTRAVDVPCPPNTPCSDVSPCSGSVSVALSCISTGINVIVTTTIPTPLFSLNNSSWQPSNIFTVYNIPAEGYTVKVLNETTQCVKSANTGYLFCPVSVPLPGREYLRTDTRTFYCPDGYTIFAIEIYDVYRDNITNLEYEEIISTVGSGTC